MPIQIVPLQLRNWKEIGIEFEFEKIHPAILESTAQNMVERANLCIEQGGDHFELGMGTFKKFRLRLHYDYASLDYDYTTTTSL